MIRGTRSRVRTRRLLAHGNPRLEEEIHDPYRTPRKARSPARCSDCGATYRKGRWTWERLQPPPPASLVCPACRRIRDRYPAGEITLGGSFFVEHADEALSLVRNVEAAEHGAHPLQKIMAIKRKGGNAIVTTTDLHVARRIAHALESAWGGELATHYDEGGYFVRISWERND
jgi:NMD protein affecting ribosome stability and mRNA decay